MGLLVYIGMLITLILIIVPFLLGITFRIRRRLQKRQNPVLAFFHPYCKDGGGGERVLWSAVKAVQEEFPDYKILVYAGYPRGQTPPSSSDILSHVGKQFRIELNENVEFCILHKRDWVEAHRYPRFTLLGQSLGSMFLALHALNQYVPDVVIDSMGYAFTYPIFKLAGCPVGCYVHYPTISTDMLTRVGERRPTYNNDERISKSEIRTRAKLYYYRAFAFLYGVAGRLTDVIVVNSHWTERHINTIWGRPERTTIVYPPCNTTRLQQIPLSPESRKCLIVSVAQFRPEKDHALQLASFSRFLESYPQWRGKVKLVLIGSSRNEEDSERITALKERSQKLKISDDVLFEVNVSYEQLLSRLIEATLGIHTMWNEHFGIGVVELMAAGVICVAHNSGGPKEDIVIPYQGQITGFLAASEEEYADAFNTVLSMSPGDRLEIQQRARISSQRFSDEKFAYDFKKCLRRLIK